MASQAKTERRYAPKAQFTRQMSYLATQEQRERVDQFVNEDVSIGSVLRELVDLGLSVKESQKEN